MRRGKIGTVVRWRHAVCRSGARADIVCRSVARNIVVSPAARPRPARARIVELCYSAPNRGGPSVENPLPQVCPDRDRFLLVRSVIRRYPGRGRRVDRRLDQVRPLAAAAPGPGSPARHRWNLLCGNDGFATLCATEPPWAGGPVGFRRQGEFMPIGRFGNVSWSADLLEGTGGCPSSAVSHTPRRGGATSRPGRAGASQGGGAGAPGLSARLSRTRRCPAGHAAGNASERG